ncbi:MAG: hypothetical protein AB7Q17_09715 [Phycisphaerae bacterium]
MSEFEANATINEASYAVNTLSLVEYLIPEAVESVDVGGAKLLRLKEDSYFLVWPPNLFAFTSMFFSVTGSYALVTQDWPPREFKSPSWRERVGSITDEWVRALRQPRIQRHVLYSADPAGWRALRTTVPDEVQACWQRVTEKMEPPRVGNVEDIWIAHQPVFRDLMTLHAVADSVCVGWGIRTLPESRQARLAAGWARELLSEFGTLATIHPARARVLPKRHTPQVGITLRSVSSNLALHRSSALAKWLTEGPHLFPAPIGPACPRDAAAADCAAIADPRAVRSLGSLSLLLLPWPLEMRARDFREVTSGEAGSGMEHASEATPAPRFFRYAPEIVERDDDLRTRLRRVFAEANREVGGIDLAILPESAIDGSQLKALEAVLRENGVRAYIAGVRRRQRADLRPENGNWVCFGYQPNSGGGFGHVWQPKHHRWRLNDWQIKSYQLGGQLHPRYTWWEDTPVRNRVVNFINFGDEITVCPLICEDLARQDPISDLIRAVGPSLVVAILMDGPQLRSRWAARYASVLADDPGSSVLTLTAAGMVDRYRVPGVERAATAPRAIALWSDRTPNMTEIILDADAEAVILNLAVTAENEFTLDSRQETIGTYTLGLGGVHQVRSRPA